MITSVHLLVLRGTTAVGMLFGGAATIHAQTNNAYPMLMCIRPAAAVIGKSTEHELSARYNLAGGMGVIVSGEGVRAEILPNETEKPEEKDRNDVLNSKCKLRWICEPNAVPGIRDFRVMTPHGVSTVGQIVIAREDVIQEVPDNDSLDKAQSVVLPATLCGTIEKGEDIDYFRFHIDHPSEWTFHMTAQRLQNRLHDMQTRVDPLLTLRSGTGATLASSDNVFAGDPLLHYRFEQPGDYVLEVRDVRYQGNSDWTYSIESSSRPFVTVVRPLAIPADAVASLRLVGRGMPDDVQVPVAAPASKRIGIVPVAPVWNGVGLNAAAVVTTRDPILEEPDPQASFAVPAMLCGSIEEAGQCDRFVFEAKGQDRLTFEVLARRLGSNLDAKLRILNEAGAVLAEVDDMVFDRVLSADAMLENWTAPSDGKYTLEVRDLHGRGGADFPYALHVTRAAPYFLLEADTDKTLLAPGNSSVVYVKAHRRNGFTGEIALSIDGLPAGVRAEGGRILANGVDGAIWLTATSDAPMGMANVSIRGTATMKDGNGEPLALAAEATNLQEVYLPGGGRGHYPVDVHTVSVGRPMDIRNIVLSSNVFALKPGQSQRIDVTIERAPDYKGNVTLDVMLQHLEQPYGNPLPKGVTVDLGASKTLLTSGENAGHLTLKAAPDAPGVERHLVPITVHVSINFVMKHTFSGEPVFVSVSPN